LQYSWFWTTRIKHEKGQRGPGLSSGASGDKTYVFGYLNNVQRGRGSCERSGCLFVLFIGEWHH
jgi:hypothetical protein